LGKFPKAMFLRKSGKLKEKHFHVDFLLRAFILVYKPAVLSPEALVLQEIFLCTVRKVHPVTGHEGPEGE
jgi:hypothetical protein